MKEGKGSKRKKERKRKGIEWGGIYIFNSLIYIWGKKKNVLSLLPRRKTCFEPWPTLAVFLEHVITHILLIRSCLSQIVGPIFSELRDNAT